MSSRQLRKLQKQRELEQLQAPTTPDNDSSESENNAPVKRAKPSMFSAFAALEGQDDEPDDDGDDGNDEDETEPAEPTKASPRPVDSSARTETPGSSAKKPKKKKKKNKKEKKLDVALASLEIDAPPPTTTDDVRVYKALSINTHHLKVINEMRNLFGREVIASALNEESEERARAQRSPLPLQMDLETFLKGQAGKTLPEVTLRRNPFLPGKETWPRASTEGLTMRQLEEKFAGTVEFAFSHDENYNKLETQFFSLVQMMDPMRLVHYLHSHPYHISSLIQVSQVAKQDQNAALSADLCERALFTFGRVAISNFRLKMEQGKARLDFRRPENRQFWLAGYHYLKNLMMKGTYRTALEWAKLLFSMDLSDPYGMIHFIHPLAIRAHESKWFIDFCSTTAVTKYGTMRDYIVQTLVLAKLQQKDMAGAKASLVQGMKELPWLYNALYKALNMDVPKAVWGMQPRDGHEELCVELYIHQTKSLWDNAQARGLLKEVAQEAKKLDSPTFKFPPRVERNVARFVHLDNTPSLMSYVPRDLAGTSPNWEFDPVPPPREENIFTHDSQQQPWMPTRPNDLPMPHPLRGFDIPRDREQRRRFLAQMREVDAPPELLAIFEQGLNELAAGDEDADEDDGDDDDDESNGGGGGNGSGDAESRGLLQNLMYLFNFGGAVGGGGGGGEEESDEPQHDHWNLAESELDSRMPGAWESESDDDEMPELIPADEDDAPTPGPGPGQGPEP
ncbi:transcriptional repressor TCF25-domain-containing protein [Nemania sp. FL0916]|nr:transcriptional repressor TCF25-domain-containing protein [Nemania sp. FL0916]